MMIGWIVLAAFCLWIAVLIIRALRFVPAQQPVPKPEAVSIDTDAATKRMQALIRCETVSYTDKAMEDPAPFEAFPALLAQLYPALHKACQQERIGTRGLLYRWIGRKAENPSVLMSHYDVVPAEATRWQHPPFAADIENGVLWGRGTLDTKGTLCSVLEAAEHLIAEGFVPENDIYLCFAGDEEISGGGAPGIVETLKSRGIHPAFVLDEGGAVVEKVFPGVAKPAALIGIGEKGSMNVTLQVESQGGHASAPPPHTPVGILARVVTRIEGHPAPFTLTTPARALFDTLGRHSTFVYRLIFANLWCFAPLLNLICTRTGGEMNALVRTTCAFTQMRGSDAANVMPPTASVGANLRIIGGETVEQVRGRLETLVDNASITVTTSQGHDPSPVSSMEGEPWQRLQTAIARTWPDAIVSPYLMVAASDARHYTAISEHVYRFSAMPLSGEERRMIHGNDERIPLEKLFETIRFYVRLIRES